MTFHAVKAVRTRGASGLAVLVGLVVNPAVLGQAREKNAALPHQVLIIRHAEKPPERDESVHLSPTGKDRAEHLHQLFRAPKKGQAPFPTPDVIFAARDSKHSHRSVETVTPLARKLKLTINSNYPDADFAKLAHEILHSGKYAGKTVLICWHHGMIPDLARALRAGDAPRHWKGNTFDRVWELTYQKNGQVTFRDLPQHLLRADSDK
jgi:broad specificity phosphatase PhoE